MRSPAALAVTLLVLAPVAASGQVPDQDGPSALTVYGHADYDWAIRELDGGAISLGAFEGRVVFINMWASWCVPCVREMASIERLREAMGDADMDFLIVAADEERPVRRFLRRYPYDLPIYLEEQRMPLAFGLRGLPTSWVVDRQGRIVLLRHGEAVWETPEVVASPRAGIEGG